MPQSNPGLNELITSSIGNNFYYEPNDLEKLMKFTEDKTLLNKLAKIKQKNKKDFAKYLKSHQGVEIDPSFRFDVHIKRIHEYKRQLLNVLKIIHLYAELLEDPDKDVTPQVFFFGGKSAAKYYMAKRIIKLICKLSADIDKNPKIASKLRVVFLENYNVSLAEKIIPATEVSEQISLAGKEASGTGNMKFMINGALTLGTYDGANVEMCEKVGRDNIFIFGLSSEEVDNEWKKGYCPKDYYENNPRINRVIKMLKEGFDGESFEDIAKYLIDGNRPDPYMCLIDFDSYIEAYEYMDKVYKDTEKWNTMSLINIAKSGFFAADRSIHDYARDIWKLKQVLK
jgi:starch phosphorylase